MTFADYSGAYARELETALEAGRRAATVILEFYEAQSATTYTKGDGSPVTDADLASDRVIRETISNAFPGDALLTEEGAKDVDRLTNDRCWIVDPIDGTAQYVARTGLFDVMIALCVDGRPVVAVSVQPVASRIQAAVAGAGAWEFVGGQANRLLFAPASTPPRLVADLITPTVAQTASAAAASGSSKARIAPNPLICAAARAWPGSELRPG